MKKAANLVFAATAILLLGIAASAATFVVTNDLDHNDGSCDAVDCTLLEALIAVSTLPNGPTHRVEFGPYFDSPRTIVTDGIGVAYNKRVEIVGRGNLNVRITIAPGNLNSIFYFAGAYARIENIAFVNGISEQDGGAIYSNDGGDLVIEKCLFDSNSAGDFGGAIFALGLSSLVVRDTTFSNNLGIDRGGAIYLDQYSLTIERCLFVGNRSVAGSAVYSNQSAMTSSIVNSTFSANASDGRARFDPNSVIANMGGTLNLTNLTVVENTSVSARPTSAVIHGGDLLPVPITNLSNSIVRNNSPSFDPLFQVTETGPNMTSGIVGFAALANNGGETKTHALLPGSAAIDAGSATGAPSTDQRGAPRPSGVGVDLGAFEFGTTAIAGSTPVGANVTVNLGTAGAVSFQNVSATGTTSALPIDPSSAGTLPGGFTLGAGQPAFQISTTAAVTVPITVCVNAATGTPLATFNTLRLMHNEGGVLVDRTVSRDFPTLRICAETTSLSPFAFASIAPTAASVSISGRVLDASGQTVRGAVVSVTDERGDTRTSRTNSFGVYRFDELPAGATVVAEVRAKSLRYSPLVLTLTDNLAGVDFIPASFRRNGK